MCDATTHDLGDVVQGDRPAHTFRIRNGGRAPLRILRVDPSYSCTAANLRGDPIAPGETVDLPVVCALGERQGTMRDDLVVHCDDPHAPELALRIEANIAPLLAFASRTIDSKAAYGESDSQEDRLTGKLAMSAHLRIEAGDAGEASRPVVAVVPAEGTRPQGLRFTFAGHAVGRGAGEVVVATGVEMPKKLSVMWSWQVLGNVEVDPTNPFIDLRGPPPIGVVVRVSSKRRDFRLDGADVLEGPFEATAARDASGAGYSVRVRVREADLPNGERGVIGRLRLVSNDPAEPHKDVPLFALGALRPP